jgi:hypothetical protein
MHCHFLFPYYIPIPPEGMVIYRRYSANAMVQGRRLSIFMIFTFILVALHAQSAAPPPWLSDLSVAVPA